MKATTNETPITLEVSRDEAVLLANILAIVDAGDRKYDLLIKDMLKELENVNVFPNDNARANYYAGRFILYFDKYVRGVPGVGGIPNE